MTVGDCGSSRKGGTPLADVMLFVSQCACLWWVRVYLFFVLDFMVE